MHNGMVAPARKICKCEGAFAQASFTKTLKVESTDINIAPLIKAVIKALNQIQLWLLNV